MADNERIELLHGTLDLIVLRALATMGPLHAYALASRLEQLAEHPLTLNQGTLYPALLRLEQRKWIRSSWGVSEANRKARFYELTARGRRQITREAENWATTVSLMERFLREPAIKED